MRIFISIFILSLALACNRQVPQLPSNRVDKTDSSELSLQLANEKLIAGEDSILNEYVAKSRLNFSKSTEGFWYKILSAHSNKSRPLKGETISINVNVYSLSDRLLLHETKTISMGKKQLINGAEQLLQLMTRGDSAIAVIPWYLAYGMKGDNGEVPPFTSIVVHLRLY